MDADQFIYGCACCGRLCLENVDGVDQLPPELCQPLSNLDALRVRQGALQTMLTDGSLAVRCIVRVQQANGTLEDAFYLHPEYMAAPGPFSSSSVALFCRRCGPHLHRGRSRTAARGPPPLRIALGYDLPLLPRLQLPELSMLERMFLKSVMTYSHIVKLKYGRGLFALSGSFICLPTTAAERVQELVRQGQTFPRRDVQQFISLTFVGPMDKLRRLTNLRPDDPLHLANSLDKIFRGT